jgi:hypothetical protein
VLIEKRGKLPIKITSEEVERSRKTYSHHSNSLANTASQHFETPMPCNTSKIYFKLSVTCMASLLIQRIPMNISPVISSKLIETHSEIETQKGRENESDQKNSLK